MKNPRAIVISVDSLFSGDEAVLMSMPGCGPLFRRYSMVGEILCSYPTLTYPCHATIATGRRPGGHGIFHNKIFSPFSARGEDWHWYAKDLRVPTLLDIAGKQGLSTASVAWPVLGGAAADYLIAEIWAGGPEDDPEPCFEAANSPSVRGIFRRNRGLLDWMRTPGFDLFAEACARDIIAEFKPDLMLVHFSYLDHQRHQQGTAGEKIREALAFIDQRIGGIRAACGDAGILEDTVFFLLGDHGQIDVKEIFGINRALGDRGFINPGKTPDYRIFCHCAGFSGQIYTRNIGEKEAYRALLALREEYPRYIEAILTREEAYSRYGLAGDFSFVVEAAEGIGLGEESRGEISGRPSGKDFTAANHGHAPEKGPKPPFIVCGGAAKPGLRIPRAELIDEAPTILSLFGVPMPGADGRVLPLLA